MTEEVKEKKEAVEDIETLKKALAEEKAKAENYLANWQRTQADFINFKRRSEQERSEMVKYANSILIQNLLPIFDDFERAFNSLPPKLLNFTWIDGIRLIYRKIQAILEREGLKEIEAKGKPFDPLYHEAVMYAEGEENIVLEEVQKGYKFHDRVLRPTLVIVGKGKTEKEGG